MHLQKLRTPHGIETSRASSVYESTCFACLPGTCILKVYHRTTPFLWCSVCFLRHRRNLLHCGKYSTRVMSHWWAWSWTVSANQPYLFTFLFSNFSFNLCECFVFSKHLSLAHECRGTYYLLPALERAFQGVNFSNHDKIRRKNN